MCYKIKYFYLSSSVELLFVGGKNMESLQTTWTFQDATWRKTNQDGCQIWDRKFADARKCKNPSLNPRKQNPDAGIRSTGSSCIMPDWVSGGPVLHAVKVAEQIQRKQLKISESNGKRLPLTNLSLKQSGTSNLSRVMLLSKRTTQLTDKNHITAKTGKDN